jgi:hypothetical protein
MNYKKELISIHHKLFQKIKKEHFSTHMKTELPKPKTLEKNKP